MFHGFEKLTVDTGEARIALRHGGSGPPLLLLHGNPQTHVAWHKIAGALSAAYHVIASDLRGYGDSVGPEDGGEEHINYSFRAMARDQIQVMRKLGYDRFFAAGHDRGGRVVHRMCRDHPGAVLKAALLDIVPTRHIWQYTPLNKAFHSWNWLFMAQPYDFPETMMASVPPEWYVRMKMARPPIGLDFVTAEALAEYARCFTWKTIRASCEDYRAGATCDLKMDLADYHQKLDMPLLVLWGKWSDTNTEYGDLLKIWGEEFHFVEGEPLDCGHYVPEEAPHETLRHFRRFFGA
jgi:haloacetate dehalogenase